MSMTVTNYQQTCLVDTPSRDPNEQSILSPWISTILTPGL